MTIALPAYSRAAISSHAADADVFGDQVFLDAVARALTAEPGLLDAAEGRHFIRYQAGVDADHSVFELLGDAEHASDVARIEVAGKPELGRVRGVDRFLLGRELEHRRDRPEGLLAREQHVARGVRDDSGLEERAAELVARAADDDSAAARLRI